METGAGPQRPSEPGRHPGRYQRAMMYRCRAEAGTAPDGGERRKPRRRPARLLAGTAVLATVLLTSVIAGCAQVPVENTATRPHSAAIDNPGDTGLGQLAGSHAPAAEMSGFAPVSAGHDAFRLLYGLTLMSERSIDVQYYIWRNDRTGRLLLAALADAAERGVRVRLLLDDLELEWPDGELARLSTHPNVEVRIFNPFVGRDLKLIDAVFDFQRVTHRMHNKAFIADNTFALVGGRNIGDSYFAAHDGPNYRDLDLLATGPIVRDISASFDAFWNSAWSISVEKIQPPSGEAFSLETFEKQLRDRAKDGRGFPTAADMDGTALRGHIEARTADLVWTRQAAVLADSPSKPATSEPEVLQELREVIDGVSRSMLVEMAYFIPGEDGLDALCGMVRDGVDIRILTNSFASNDVITAYSAYRKFREPAVRCGIQLHELRNDPGLIRGDIEGHKDTSSANLHTKAAVLDGEDVLIGSFNFDPRSIHLNTEIALLVRSEELAAAVSDFIEDSLTPEHAYHLVLNDHELAWVVSEGGEQKITHDEPRTTFWRSVASFLISLLPIQQQL